MSDDDVLLDDAGAVCATAVDTQANSTVAINHDL
jgi:hypothetical protein